MKTYTRYLFRTIALMSLFSSLTARLPLIFLIEPEHISIINLYIKNPIDYCVILLKGICVCSTFT